MQFRGPVPKNISTPAVAVLLFVSLFGITAMGQNFSAQIITYDWTVNPGQSAWFMSNGSSGVNGAFFTNYGTVQADANFAIGTYNWAVFTQNAGTFNVNDYLSIARYGDASNSSGALRVNGGWVNAWNRVIIVGESGDGWVGIYGGGVYAPWDVALSGNAGSKGTLELNGGQLVTSRIYKWGAGIGTLYLNGGTLQATRDEWNYISGLDSANIGGNGAVINNDGKGIGINQTLTGSGSGSVKFDGSNWTTLRQNNTYTGDTLVRGGVLQFYENGSLYNNGTAAGNIYVNSGATLYFNRDNVFGNADTGSSSPVTITLNGGTINNGNGGVTGGGIFNNLANLTMNGGNLNASGGSASGWNAYELNQVTVGGSSASTITANTSINSNNAILLSRAGTTTFNVGSTGDATGDLKVSARLTDGNGVVGSLTKTGAGKMVLSAANTYTGPTVITAGVLQVGNGGTGGTIGSGNVTNHGTLIFNRSDALTISNLISGSGSVTKTGTNTATFTASNSLTGTFTHVGGITVLSNAAAPVFGSLSNLVISNDYAGANYYSVVETLSPNGLGTNVNLIFRPKSASNSLVYFQLNGNDQSIGNLDGSVQFTAATPSTPSAWPIIQNAEANISVASRLTIHQIIDGLFFGEIRDGGTANAGALSLVKNGPATLVLAEVSASWKGIGHTGTTTINEGQLTLSNTTRFVSATTVQNTGTLQVIGSLSNTATVSATNGGTVVASGTIRTLNIRNGGKIRITNAATVTNNAWNSGGTINFTNGSQVEVDGVSSLAQQPYILLRGTNVTGTPALSGSTNFAVTNVSNTIQLVPTLDSDGDTLADYAELTQHNTDPAKSDTDGDGIDDNVEIAAGTDALGTWNLSGLSTTPVFTNSTATGTNTLKIQTGISVDYLIVGGGGAGGNGKTA
ncbi:MAG: hypothetical protein EBV83_05960, partial [Verrucomicrobia bacterium]|nr:hypothetical protein [Verrucomicrobiota bacterium]